MGQSLESEGCCGCRWAWIMTLSLHRLPRRDLTCSADVDDGNPPPNNRLGSAIEEVTRTLKQQQNVELMRENA